MKTKVLVSMSAGLRPFPQERPALKTQRAGPPYRRQAVL